MDKMYIEALKIVKDLKSYQPLFWVNPKYNYAIKSLNKLTFNISDMMDAESRFHRFAPFLKKVFNLESGIIESKLIPLEKGLYLKGDHSLPISGSIKARGGIYEILKLAEKLLLENNLISIHDDYSLIADDTFKRFFNQYEIVVSSTGNLGLSIGIISSTLGFKVHVHMSHDAMQWKKDKLKSIGVNVIEHQGDYSKAVEIGRQESVKKANSFFIDDENSIDLFMGYAVAAFRLKEQLDQMHIEISKEKPLFVYLPCGVGGGPGGITFGLKQVFKDLVHCVFVEPTHAPCMLLGLATETHDTYAVQDFGIDNLTVADGLAVGKASKFVGKTIEEILLGVSTVDDGYLFDKLKFVKDTYDIKLEPSALAGFKGYDDLMISPSLHGHLVIEEDKIKSGTHIVWATGGEMVPAEVFDTYYNK